MTPWTGLRIRKVAMFICWGHRDGMPQTKGLTLQKFISPQFWRQKSQVSGPTR